jgi:alkylhydroperoxidase family enzyme
MADVFNVFMDKHPPVGDLVEQAEKVLWEESALHPVVKEEMRIAAAVAIGCNYCARFRTSSGDGLVIDGEMSAEDRARADCAKQLVTKLVRREETDALVEAAAELFDDAEFTDLVFSAGWYIGTQHIGRLLHWDESCPITPIRQMVESGQAA